MGYLQDGHGTSLIGVSDHLPANQLGVGGRNRGDPGLNLKHNTVSIETRANDPPEGETEMTPYFVPAVVLGVAVTPGRRSIVSLRIHGFLHILNQYPVKRSSVHQFISHTCRFFNS